MTKSILEKNKDEIIKFANQFCQNMVQRGGGAKDMRVRVLKENSKQSIDGMIALDLLVNVNESMGANILNTIAENISPYIQSLLTSGRILLKILSNLSTNRTATAEFKIPLANLKYKNIEGKEIAKRIVQAYEIANYDIYRATTHNKGIFNGIDAVALALGQDWRAIEAGGQAYATLGKQCFLFNR